MNHNTFAIIMDGGIIADINLNEFEADARAEHYREQGHSVVVRSWGVHLDHDFIMAIMGY